MVYVHTRRRALFVLHVAVQRYAENVHLQLVANGRASVLAILTPRQARQLAEALISAEGQQPIPSTEP